MTRYPHHIDEEYGYSPSIPAEGRETGSRAAILWDDPMGRVKIGLWKADPGRYAGAGRPYSETFAVLKGEAEVWIGNAGPRTIRPGSVVHIPAGEDLVFNIRTDFAKFTTTVMEG